MVRRRLAWPTTAVGDRGRVTSGRLEEKKVWALTAIGWIVRHSRLIVVDRHCVEQPSTAAASSTGLSRECQLGSCLPVGGEQAVPGGHGGGAGGLGPPTAVAASATVAADSVGGGGDGDGGGGGGGRGREEGRGSGSDGGRRHHAYWRRRRPRRRATADWAARAEVSSAGPLSPHTRAPHDARCAEAWLQPNDRRRDAGREGVEYDVPDPVLKVSSLLAFAPLTLEPGADLHTRPAVREGAPTVVTVGRAHRESVRIAMGERVHWSSLSCPRS